MIDRMAEYGMADVRGEVMPRGEKVGRDRGRKGEGRDRREIGCIYTHKRGM